MSNFRQYLAELKNNQLIKSVNANDTKQIKEIEKYIGFTIPGSYLDFLIEIGYGMHLVSGFDFNGTGKQVTAVLYDTDRDIKSYSSIPYKKPPFRFLTITDIGDDVVWYMNLNEQDPITGECPIVGWISGLSAEEQPDWVKKEEYFPSFEAFFRAKVGVREEDLENE